MDQAGAASLATFGLSTAADQVWHLLLRSPDIAPATLRRQCGLDHEQFKAAVDELRASELVEPALTPLGLVPADPTRAVEHRLAAEQRELAARLSQLSELRALLPALAHLYAQGRQRIDRELPIEVVDGLEATRHRLLVLGRATQTETLSIEDQLSTAGQVASLDEDLASLDRGVACRTIVPRKYLENEECFRIFGLRAAAGEQIRITDQVPARMLVVDNELVAVPLDADDLARGAIFLRVRTIVDMCVFLFERMWAEAAPLFVVADDDAPSGRAARVLELMAAGRKDDAIARALGVGVRTVRRDIATLMSELGEHTRAATVAAAMRRGWLSA